MPEDRLSYTDFRKELLFAFAVFVDGDFDQRAYAADAAALVEGKFKTSWIKAAAEWLAEQEYFRLRPPPSSDRETFSVFDNLSAVDRLRQIGRLDEVEPDFYSLTEKGYLEAAQYGRYQNKNLEVEMEKFLEAGGPGSVSYEPIQEHSVIIAIDRTSDEIVAVENTLSETLTKVGESNALVSDPDGSQRLAELRAAKSLLSAAQMNLALFKKIVIPALQSLLAKVTDEGLKLAIKAALTALVAWILSMGG
ncbi:hypothetical protein ELG65_09110 [Rhizobium leguminosarum]|uniref:hypothetical protein n=1 Tax=Rhizobium leguminosarum TaxID=384 RepID=UPI001030657F|nr:hypothetical protein [Rhizobium leguminosarum]TBH58557.1 hypothetical protein ELG65_09110 [Rhizobium leguminosarum]